MRSIQYTTNAISFCRNNFKILIQFLLPTIFIKIYITLTTSVTEETLLFQPLTWFNYALLMLTTTAFAFFWHRFYLTGKNFADYRKDVASQKSYKFRLTKFILFSLFYSVAIYIAYFVISLFVGIFINYTGAILRYFLTNTYLINAIIVSLIFLITSLMITFILASTLPYFPSLATRIEPLPLEIL